MNKGLVNLTSGVYISPVVPLSNAASSSGIVFNHGLGTSNIVAAWSLVCLTGTRGFSPGDEIDLAYATYLAQSGMQSWKNSAQVGFFMDEESDAGNFYYYSKTGGTLTTGLNAPWGIRCRVQTLLP